MLQQHEQRNMRLVDRIPTSSKESLVEQMWVPPEFLGARFDNYRPDPLHPSQAAAQSHMSTAVAQLAEPRRFFRRRRPIRHTYLDGGFGVGKTHLLAAAAHELGADQARFGTFAQYTQLVGALGYHPTLAALAQYTVVCIDEFELDDPGDTLIMARLVRDLGERGTTVIATSNTLPEKLGDGRFAATDFQREIQGLSDRFTVVSIDGPDYRHRDGMIMDQVWEDSEIRFHRLQQAAVDDFSELMAHLSRIHPSHYRDLISGIPVVIWRNAMSITRENQGLRLVALVDRLYDAQIPTIITGCSVAGLFGPELIHGAYRKKYLRCQSRLSALSQKGHVLLGADPVH